MENTKQYFTQTEALEDIKDVLENGYGGYYTDLHNEVFNTDYYIIGTYEAKQALEQVGVFEAIECIKNYENDNFGEVTTDFSQPVEVANMLHYIIGLEAIDSIDFGFADLADDDANKEIVKEINEML